MITFPTTRKDFLVAQRPRVSSSRQHWMKGDLLLIKETERRVDDAVGGTTKLLPSPKYHSPKVLSTLFIWFYTSFVAIVFSKKQLMVLQTRIHKRSYLQCYPQFDKWLENLSKYVIYVESYFSFGSGLESRMVNQNNHCSIASTYKATWF